MAEIVEGELVEQRIDRVLTQYRESPKLLHLIRTHLRQVEEAAIAVDSIPSFFEIETAVGDQLTLIGRRLGWPRCHCVCDVQPVFGFACEGVPADYPLAGFCDENSTWADCNAFGLSEICITDDETYRRFVKVRRYQMLRLFDLASLTAAVQTFWGGTATVLDAGHGRAVVAPGRALTEAEEKLLQLYPRVMPIAPGVVLRFHFGGTDVFGFGSGWGEFCEPWEAIGLPLATENGNVLVTETGQEISTGPLTQDAEWMCEIDPKPYGCI